MAGCVAKPIQIPLHGLRITAKKESLGLNGENHIAALLVIALIESPQVRSAKFPTCERWSVYRLAGAGGGCAEGVGGGVVVA